MKGHPARRVHAGRVLLLAMALAAGSTAAQGPRRIVSLVPAVTEMLFAIGAGDSVVGVGSFDEFPPEVASRPRVGALLDPDLERILSLTPTLVVVYASQEDLKVKLARADIDTFDYRHGGLADIPATIRAIGRRAGRGPEAETAAHQLEAELDEVRRLVSTRPRPKVAMVFGREPGALRGIFVSGGVGFLHDVLGVAGGINAFADVAREGFQPSVETIIARAPDVILEVRAESAAMPSAADWSVLPTVPAVRTHRVIVVSDTALVVPGPRIGAAARRLARVLHGQLAQGSGLKAQGRTEPGGPRPLSLHP